MSRPGSVPDWAEFGLIEHGLQGAGADSALVKRALDLLRRWAPESELERALATVPALVCCAYGGDAQAAAPVSAIWQLMRYAAKLLDDIQDGDAGERTPFFSNTATALMFAAQALIDEIEPIETRLIVQRRLTQASLLSCSGQHDDLMAAGVSPDRWLDIAGKKSGAGFGWALAAGGAAAGIGACQLDALNEAGFAAGILVQIADDYAGVWQSSSASDLAGRQPSLPVAYALSVATPAQQARLRSHLLAARKGSRRRERKARQMIVELGGPAFMLAAARLEEQNMVERLDKAQCPEALAGKLVGMARSIFPSLTRTD